MERPDVSRRRFAVGLTAVLSLPLAGCLSGDEESDDDENGGDDFELEDRAHLTIHIENEDGEPVSHSLSGTIEPVEGTTTYNFSEEIDEGTREQKVAPGEYTVIVESDEDGVETQETSVELEEGDEETVTITLEGATADEELADDGEESEESEDEDEEE